MEELKNQLKCKGLKTTRHRLSILEALKHSSEPLSAEQVFLQIKKDDVSINLSTVYRALEILTEKGMVSSFNLSGSDKTLFELSGTGHRHFLVCLSCKKMLPVMHCPLGCYEDTVEKETGFSVTGHRLDIYGYCKECQEKTTK